MTDLNEKKAFRYSGFFVSASDLYDYTRSGIKPLIDSIIYCVSKDDFEINSRNAYKGILKIIEMRGFVKGGVYSEEAKAALDNVYKRYYDIFSETGEKKIVLNSRKAKKTEILFEKARGIMSSVSNFGKALVVPFTSGAYKKFLKKFSFPKIAVKKPSISVKRPSFSVKKPKSLKYYLGAAAFSGLAFLGLKSNALSFLKGNQEGAQEKNKTELAETPKKSAQPSQEVFKIQPKGSNASEQSKVEEVKEKDPQSTAVKTQQTKTMSSAEEQPDFYQSRLDKFLGEQGAKNLCDKVKSKCPQMTEEDVKFVAYGYVMNKEYALGTNNPINKALSSATPLTGAEQADLVKYVEGQIGFGGEIARERAQKGSSKQSMVEQSSHNEVKSSVQAQESTVEQGNDTVVESAVQTQQAETMSPADQTLLEFHQSRLNKFLGPKKAKELCKRIDKQVKKGIFYLDEGVTPEYMAYAYVMQNKYNLGRNNPISRALWSTEKLSEVEQDSLINYIKYQIGEGGEFARKRAKVKAVEEAKKEARAKKRAQVREEKKKAEEAKKKALAEEAARVKAEKIREAKYNALCQARAQNRPLTLARLREIKRNVGRQQNALQQYINQQNRRQA